MELHRLIDETEDKECLQTILGIIEQYKKTNQLTDEQLELLMKREDAYLKGETKGVTLEAFKAKMNAKYGL